ncbi:MAG: sugar phosphate nucleotidyltransferase [Acidimicrobiia bacterium]|nr:sugar phosphate nucleotidyltransferase [Acidimicrobiia bacterium]
MRNVVTAILGGGQGSRLWPLTRDRAKPAVPVAGKFRLIDVPISNSLRAGMDRVYVLTQFNSESLHRHVAQTYRFDAFRGGFVNLLAAEQSTENRDWYQGTGDAVRQNLHRFLENDPTEIVILSGDQLYLMDLAEFVRQHRARNADLTIALSPVPPDEAGALGIMRLDRSHRIVEFVEKPQDPAEVERLTLDAATVEATGVDAEPGTLLASMGMYVFRTDVLVGLLEGYDGDDFGKELIPQAVRDFDVFGFTHPGYWRDIGTIGSFHEASIELTHQLPALNLYDPEFPIYTHPRFLPGSKVTDCHVYESILSDGSIVYGSKVTSSIIGVRAVVRSGTTIERSVIMGAGRFEDRPPTGTPALGIGHGCHIRNAIVDMDARIGDGCRLVNESGVRQADGAGWHIRDGIVVVPKGAVIPPGTVV